jgi:hypothetical protein
MKPITHLIQMAGADLQLNSFRLRHPELVYFRGASACAFICIGIMSLTLACNMNYQVKHHSRHDTDKDAASAVTYLWH